MQILAIIALTFLVVAIVAGLFTATAKTTREEQITVSVLVICFIIFALTATFCLIDIVF